MTYLDLPPAGFRANEDRGPQFIVFSMSMIFISIVAVGLRFWSRSMAKPSFAEKRRFWWDDWAALAAAIFTTADISAIIVMAHICFGKHIWNIPRDDLVLSLKWGVPLALFYMIGISIAKASALLFYSRVFPHTASPLWFNRAIIATHTMNILWLIGASLGFIFRCQPFEENWTSGLDGTCGTFAAYQAGMAIPHLIIDLIILVLPLPMIWRLNCLRSQKIGLTTIFVLGYSAVIITVGRIIVSVALANDLVNDFTSASISIFYWQVAEVPMILVCVCLPAMSHLAQRVRVSLISFCRRVRPNSTPRNKLGHKITRPTKQQEKQIDKTQLNHTTYKADAFFASANRDVEASRPLDDVRIEEGKIYIDTTFTVHSVPDHVP